MTLARKPKKKTRNDFDLWRGLIVKIVWNDPLSCGESTEAELAREPDIIFTSYGEIVGKTSKNLTLASTTGNEPRDRLLREITRIPICLVKSVVLLEATKEELKI